MQLVISIDDSLYRTIKNNGYIYEEEAEEIAFSIIGGTQLPKSHGRLIDADELYGDFIDGTEGYDCQTWNRIEIGDVIENAPTIVEADKEVGE